MEDDVHLAVRPALPIDEIDVILGNDLAGDHVWANGSPLAKPPPVVKELVNDKQELPDVFPVCVVTSSMSKAEFGLSVQKDECDVKLDLQMPKSFAISQQELISEQWADAAL